VDVVEVHDAITWHTILLGGQNEFADEAAPGPGQCRHDHTADSVGHWVSCKHEYRPITARRGRKPDLTCVVGYALTVSLEVAGIIGVGRS
jgi:hypothetical protein